VPCASANDPPAPRTDGHLRSSCASRTWGAIDLWPSLGKSGFSSRGSRWASIHHGGPPHVRNADPHRGVFVRGNRWAPYHDWETTTRRLLVCLVRRRRRRSLVIPLRGNDQDVPDHGSSPAHTTGTSTAPARMRPNSSWGSGQGGRRDNGGAVDGPEPGRAVLRAFLPSAPQRHTGPPRPGEVARTLSPASRTASIWRCLSPPPVAFAGPQLELLRPPHWRCWPSSSGVAVASAGRCWANIYIANTEGIPVGNQCATSSLLACVSTASWRSRPAAGR